MLQDCFCYTFPVGFVWAFGQNVENGCISSSFKPMIGLPEGAVRPSHVRCLFQIGRPRFASKISARAAAVGQIRSLALIARAVAVRAAPHDRPAGGADVALPLNHAGCDAIHVRDTLPAEAQSVALTGRALIGRTLGSGRHRYERRGPYRDGGKNSRDQVAHTIFVKVVG